MMQTQDFSQRNKNGRRRLSFLRCLHIFLEIHNMGRFLFGKKFEQYPWIVYEPLKIYLAGTGWFIVMIKGQDMM